MPPPMISCLHSNDVLTEIIQNQKAFIPTNDGQNIGRKAAGDVGINRDAVIKMTFDEDNSR